MGGLRIQLRGRFYDYSTEYFSRRNDIYLGFSAVNVKDFYFLFAAFPPFNGMNGFYHNRSFLTDVESPIHRSSTSRVCMF